jgi:hypothetical protein
MKEAEPTILWLSETSTGSTTFSTIGSFSLVLTQENLDRSKASWVSSVIALDLDLPLLESLAQSLNLIRGHSIKYAESSKGVGLNLDAELDSFDAWGSDFLFVFASSFLAVPIKELFLASNPDMSKVMVNGPCT